MGLQKKAPLPSRLSGNAKTNTVIGNKVPTATLSNNDAKKVVIDYSKTKALSAAEIIERQRKTKEQALADEIAKEQEKQKNSITFFKTPSNEDFEKLMKCYENLPHKLKNIEVRNMRSTYELDLDLDDDDWDELDLDADFEGVSIEAKRDGSEEIFLNLPMQEDFVNAINANTEKLKEKYETLKSRYVGTDEKGKEITIKPFDKEYEREYNSIVDEEHEFLFGDGDESIINMFNASKDEVIDKLVKTNPKDKEFKNEFKKLKKNLKIEVKFSDPIEVVTRVNRDANGCVTSVKTKSINTKLKLTLKYPKKAGGTPKEIFSETFNLLDN